MAIYRAYFIDQNDRVISFRPIEAATDEEALALAREFTDGVDVEVWYLDRQIGRLARR